jgi:peptidoglycan/LPS O-acetylase OafA/YrhL
MKTETAQRSYYPALDGLRGAAILLIVFYHNFGFINYFFFGWLGVDLFFVLSGFLITEILLKTRNDPHFLRNFYIRRVLRIFPLYYLMLTLFLILIPLFHKNFLDLPYFIHHQFWLWSYLQNWLYIFYPPGGALSLTHLWSLAVEEQYYVLWPFIILLLKKAKVLFILLLVLLITVIALRFIIWTYTIENLAYFNLYTFSRIDGICIGSMLALLRSWNSNAVKKYFTLIVFGLAGLNFLFYFFNRAYHYNFPFLAIVGYTTFAVLFSLLVNEAVTKENRIINFVFTIPMLKFFGKISYSLYVFHWPLHLILFPAVLSGVTTYFFFTPMKAQIISSIITTTAGIGVSILSYYFFERTFLKMKNKFA